jgi:hypothetical protein
VHACDELRGGCVAASVGTTAGARVCVTRGAARQRRAPHLPVAHAAALGQHELLGEPVKHVRERQEAEVRVVVVQALVVRLEVRVAPRDGRHEARVRDHHALGVACHERWHVRVVVVVVCVCVGGGGVVVARALWCPCCRCGCYCTGPTGTQTHAPVVPDVYMMVDRSPGLGGSGTAGLPPPSCCTCA